MIKRIERFARILRFYLVNAVSSDRIGVYAERAQPFL
ncbi:hypothetical protein MiSe_40050 [Microseira wollei NIES-4236]|uniref:Uncharacterized protein n=1 Tax=Microseira wollei NIES-4236 TaxID=2530354 RepID=A0AAV3XCX9_9CYAN|nr:hypothetical protein MiSe_40050 [Microseira wollei NIES-4236]